MKAKQLFLLACSLLLSLGLQAQSPKAEVILAGTPWSVQGISPNGRFISGTRQYQEAYVFDTKTKTLTVTSATTTKTQLVLFDVMDNGAAVGKNDAGIPGIFADGVWTDLPLPTVPYGDATMLYVTNSTGSKILGQLSIKPSADVPYKIHPVLWTRQEDGTYTYEILPSPETDFVGEGAPQFISPRQMSEDGKTISALIMDKRGKYPMQGIYKQGDDGKWTLSMPFVSVFCNMDKYEEIKKKEPKMSTMVTAKPGTKEYFAQIEAFQIAYAKWDYEMRTVWYTGNEFTPIPVVMSESGQYIASAYVKTVYEYKEGDLSVQKKSFTYYPALYDINTGDFIEFPKLVGYAPSGVTNAGDMIATNNTDIFIIEQKNKEKAYPLKEWLKERYDLDLYATLPSNTVTLSAPAINGLGNIIVGKYVSQKPDKSLDKQDIFCVRLYDRDGAKAGAVEAITQPQVAVFPNPTSHLVQVSGAKPNARMRLIDFTGQLIKEGQVDSTGSLTIDIADLDAGMYLVQVEGSKSIMVKKD